MEPESSISMRSADELSHAILWRKGKGGRVLCDLCAHRCSILPDNSGVCKVRLNRGGELLTAVHNRLIAANPDPIEKKPLFHFLPGTVSYSIATLGCNFRCDFCQNWRISQYARNHEGMPGSFTTPAEVLRAARRSGAGSIAYTYTEPTIFFETCVEVGELAREAGLKNIFVTNGYLTPEAVKRAGSFLDAANVDLKGFDDSHYRKTCGATLKGVLEGIEALAAQGVWLEITTLVVPGYNDSETELKQVASHIAALNPSIPWHLSRFYPNYRMEKAVPTPLATLERAWELGREAGLKYVYLGNVPGHASENTLCPNCGTIVIGRRGYCLAALGLRDGRCPECGTPIAGVF